MAQAAAESGCIDDGYSWLMDSVLHGSVELGCFTVDGNTSNGTPEIFLKKCVSLALGHPITILRQPK